METTSKTFWQTACELKIGPVPAPVYLVLVVIVAAATIFGQLPADMVGGIAIMMVMGILLGDIGLKVPILKDIGGPAILSIFIPSAMVYYGLLNSDAVKAITAFTKGANFLYFYISCLVVGSILGMVRTVLVQGFLRMFVPLVVGTVAASILGCIAGMLCGEDLYHTFFFIVIPILRAAWAKASFRSQLLIRKFSISPQISSSCTSCPLRCSATSSPSCPRATSRRWASASRSSRGTAPL